MGSGSVLIVDFLTADLTPEREILGDLADIATLNATSEDELAGQVEQADALMLYHTIGLSRKTLERLERCRLIVRCGAGFDNVDHQFARSRGIPVANVPDYGTEEVADSAIGLALSLSRGIHFLNSRLRDGAGPWTYEQVVPTYRLRRRCFGIIGLGRIGSATALRAKSLGMNVVYYDPYKPDGYDKSLGIRRVRTLDELLEMSHIVSIHCPLSDETHHLIDADALAKMPKGSFLVNTARGGIVEPQAVVDAIASGRLEGAGIDVLDVEPPAPSNPLVAAWRNAEHPAHHRVIINPHAAFYCEEGLMDMRISGANACRAALQGEPIPNVIN